MVQGSDNGETHLTFISIPMMEVIEQLALDYIIQLPRNKKIWSMRRLELVDDKRDYTNFTLQLINLSLREVMEKPVLM